MTTITTPPPGPDTVAGNPGLRGPAAADDRNKVASFLAPAAEEDGGSVLRTSDCDEQAMRRLRDPFAVDTTTAR